MTLRTMVVLLICIASRGKKTKRKTRSLSVVCCGCEQCWRSVRTAVVVPSRSMRDFRQVVSPVSPLTSRDVPRVTTLRGSSTANRDSGSRSPSSTSMPPHTSDAGYRPPPRNRKSRYLLLNVLRVFSIYFQSQSGPKNSRNSTRTSRILCVKL